MKYLVWAILALALSTDPLLITKINRAKTKAKEAYNAGDYKTAIKTFRYLIDSLQVNEDEISLNLANAYYMTKDTTQAYSTYELLTGSKTPEVRSKAQQQLGIMHHQQGKYEEALNNFKQAIKADANNTMARYNYEMLKKKLDEKKKEDEKKNNNDQNKPKEPSAFAKRLKAQADALAAQFKFKEAGTLMHEGMLKDNSVEFYSSFIKRLDDVNGINAKKK